MISLKCDLGDIPAGIEKMLADDLPFTIARFLTLQAQSGQAATQEKVRGVFRLRNDWTVRNVKITAAKKDTQFSEVFTDTANRQTGAPDYLPGQQEGREKTPFGGHSYLAIPTRYLRRIAPGIIPKALRPRTLLPANAQLGQVHSARFGSVGKAAAQFPRSQRQTAALDHGTFAAFLQQTRSGVLCIFVRHGGVANLRGVADAEPWYTLVREAHIKARFPMEQVVQAALAADQEKNFDRAAAEVLVNNALRSGLRVQF